MTACDIGLIAILGTRSRDNAERGTPTYESGLPPRKPPRCCPRGQDHALIERWQSPAFECTAELSLFGRDVRDGLPEFTENDLWAALCRDASYPLLVRDFCRVDLECRHRSGNRRDLFRLPVIGPNAQIRGRNSNSLAAQYATLIALRRPMKAGRARPSGPQTAPLPKRLSFGAAARTDAHPAAATSIGTRMPPPGQHEDHDYRERAQQQKAYHPRAHLGNCSSWHWDATA